MNYIDELRVLYHHPVILKNETAIQKRYGEFSSKYSVYNCCIARETLLSGGYVPAGVMSPERTTLSAQVDTDAELAQQFETYRAQNGMTSKSEAVRHLIRAGLEDELKQPDDADDDDDDDSRQPQPAHTAVDSDPSISVDIIKGNEPIIISSVFWLGSDGILSALTAVAGEIGRWVFIIMGAVLIVWLVNYIFQNWRADDVQTSDRGEPSPGGAD